MADFINLTPFDALCYSGYDTKDQAYEIVVCCAEYHLEQIADSQQRHITHKQDFKVDTIYQPHINDADPTSLCLTDEFYGETLITSVLYESDLSPYKPKCDIVIQGHAYNKTASHHFDASFSLCCIHPDNELKVLLDKEISIFGEAFWVLRSDKAHVNIRDFGYFYKMTEPKLTSKMPLRYEHALGGQNLIIDQGNTVYNEVCYANPIGTGWLCDDYFDQLKKYHQPIPTKIKAPSILPKGKSLFEPLITKQSGAMTAQQMAVLHYPNAATGFSFTHRSWSPRIAKAGTYDEAWLKNRHPFYPKDFDFNHYNSAPIDQQIDFPDLQLPHFLLINNLSPRAGFEAIALPRHRAFVLASMLGTRVPIPMQVDTIVFDTDKMTLKLVWRTALLQSFEPSEIQLRFEVDPESPLIKFKGASNEP